MVVLGRITAPYGVQGWLKVVPFGDDPGKWQLDGWQFGANADADVWQGYQVEAFRPHSDLWLLKLVGVDDRAQAEEIAGWYIATSRKALPNLESGEYYWDDLIGATVENAHGECLGKVTSLLETGANHVLVVRDDLRERLLPFVSQVVADVDVASKRISVDWEREW